MATINTTYANLSSSQSAFEIRFSFLELEDIKVAVKPNGQSEYITKTVNTDYTLSGITVTFNSALSAGDSVQISRATKVKSPRHKFAAGSTITAKSLNDNAKQMVFALEEVEARTDTGPSGGSKNHIYVNPSNTDDWTITSGAIQTTHLGANSVDSDQYVDGSIDTIHIADDQVTYGKIQNIVTANRVLGRASAGEVQEVQVATAMIADDAVTYAKMQDIGTANRVLGRASTGEVQEVQVTGAMIAANTVTASNLVVGAAIPVGTVIWYAGSTAPSGYLKCNGDTLPNNSTTAVQGITADWTTLYAIVGASLPDLRGEFIRGWDDGKGTDSGRSIRSAQTDSWKEHQHIFGGDDSVGAGTWDSAGSAYNYNQDADSDSSNHGRGYVTSRDTTGANNTTTYGDTETRSRNIALLACIKY